MSYLDSRDECPNCKCEETNILYELSYSDKILKEYLLNFYQNQGKINYDLLENEEYILVKCNRCDLVYQKNIPNDEMMKILYDEWISPEINLGLSFEHDKEYYQNIANEIIDIINYFDRKPYDLKFLDFGMGWGKWVHMAKSLGVKSFGAELSKFRIRHAEKMGLQVANLNSKIKFDFINTEQVFEHLSNPNEIFKFLIQFLSVKGIIKISVPNGKNVLRNLKNNNWNLHRDHEFSLNMVSPLEHINCFNKKSIIHLGEQFGFQEVNNIRIEKFTNISLKDFIKLKSRPFYSKLYKPKDYSTCIYLKKM